MAFLTLPRNGKFDMPPMIVVGRPLHYLGETHPIGAPFADDTNPIRMRQLYDQRRIAPAVPSVDQSGANPPAVSTRVTTATTPVGSTAVQAAPTKQPIAAEATSADTELAASTQPTRNKPKKPWGRR